MKQARHNYVILTEGTGQGVAGNRTNVSLLRELLCEDDRQRVQFLSGCGTHFGALLSGRLFGADALRLILKHLETLTASWQRDGSPADASVFVFGFSRGALIARAVCDVLCKTGVATNPNDTRDIVKWHREGRSDKLAAARRDGRLNSVRVRYLGCWDTVDATPAIDGFKIIDVPSELKEARHAVALHERRKLFDYLPMRGPQVTERFFAGSHSDIGGGYTDNHILSDLTLRWITAPAVRAGLRLKPNCALPRNPDLSRAILHDSGKLHPITHAYGLIGQIKRTIDTARLHPSARAFLKKSAGRATAAQSSKG